MPLTIRQGAFPFIIGCGRSGTTLLRAMLNAHPELAIPGESYFPVWFARFAARYDEEDGFARERFLGDLMAHEYFQLWGLPEDTVRAALDDVRPRDFPDAVRTVYALYARQQGKSVYGDKTPVFVSHVRTLAGLFPEAVFVHLLRDGRDVALSIVDVAWGPDSLDQAALYWRQQVRRGLRAARSLGPARYHAVRYEDLLEAPAAELEKLCGFLGLDYAEQMLSYASSADRLLAGLPNPQEHGGLRSTPAPRRNWRDKLSAEDRQVFELLAGDVLSEVGYQIGDRRPSRAARLRAGRARAEWESAQLRRRGRRATRRLLDKVDAGMSRQRARGQTR
jgi:hypothetical protein